MRSGEPNYQYFKKDTKPNIVKGTFDKNNEEILYTVEVDKKD